MRPAAKEKHRCLVGEEDEGLEEEDIDDRAGHQEVEGERQVDEQNHRHHEWKTAPAEPVSIARPAEPKRDPRREECGNKRDSNRREHDSEWKNEKRDQESGEKDQEATGEAHGLARDDKEFIRTS